MHSDLDSSWRRRALPPPPHTHTQPESAMVSRVGATDLSECGPGSVGLVLVSQVWFCWSTSTVQFI